MIRVKICGMASADDVAISVDAGADALGFIFAAGPKRLTVDAARELTSGVPAFVTTVGVFANDDAALVRDAIERCRIDVLQFSGDESPEFCGSFGKPTLVAARGRRWTQQRRDRARAVGVLIDSWSPEAFGGTGRVVDRATIDRAREDHEGARLVLAGGLNPLNVAMLVRAAQPEAVDVRTGVEREGAKDAALVSAFVKAARNAF